MKSFFIIGAAAFAIILAKILFSMLMVDKISFDTVTTFDKFGIMFGIINFIIGRYGKGFIKDVMGFGTFDDAD